MENIGCSNYKISQPPIACAPRWSPQRTTFFVKAAASSFAACLPGWMGGWEVEE